MSDHEDEPTAGISDDRLPEDLRPTDDNPLAKPLTEEDDPKSAEELDVLGGKAPEETAGTTGEGSDGSDDQRDGSAGSDDQRDGNAGSDDQRDGNAGG